MQSLVFICGAAGSAATATFFAFFALFTITFKTFAPPTVKDKVADLWGVTLGKCLDCKEKVKAKAAAAKAAKGESAFVCVLAALLARVRDRTTRAKRGRRGPLVQRHTSPPHPGDHAGAKKPSDPKAPPALPVEAPGTVVSEPETTAADPAAAAEEGAAGAAI